MAGVVFACSSFGTRFFAEEYHIISVKSNSMLRAK